MKPASYLIPAFQDLDSVVTKAAARITDHFADEEYSAIVCTGISGLIVSPSIAMILNKKLVVVRKPDDTSNHSKLAFEGYLTSDDDWIFLDDFVDTGSTRDYVITTLRNSGYTEGIGQYEWRHKHALHWTDTHRIKNHFP